MENPERPNSREAMFLSQLGLIERVTSYVCARRHLKGAEADDFASHVKLKLVEGDYAILGKFQGRSSLRTYLTIVIQRLFLDYRNSMWGKWRPSAEARRRGQAAVLLEQLLVRDGFSLDEACEAMIANHRLSLGRSELERLAATFPVRTRRRFEGEKVLVDVPASERPADVRAGDGDSQVLANRLSETIRKLMERFEPQDRLMIAMRFEDGRSVAEIAAALHLDQKRLYRRFEGLMHELRAGLEAEGLNADAVMKILESPAVSIDWSDSVEKSTRVRL